MFSRGARSGNSQQPSFQPVHNDRIPPRGADGYGAPPLPGRLQLNGERSSYDRGYQDKPSHSRALPENLRMNGGGGRQSTGGQTWQLRPAKSPANEFTFGNR